MKSCYLKSKNRKSRSRNIYESLKIFIKSASSGIPILTSLMVVPSKPLKDFSPASQPLAPNYISEGDFMVQSMSSWRHNLSFHFLHLYCCLVYVFNHVQVFILENPERKFSEKVRDQVSSLYKMTVSAIVRKILIVLCPMNAVWMLVGIIILVKKFVFSGILLIFY